MYTKSGSSTSAPMRTNPNKNIHTPQTMYTINTPTKKRRYFGIFCCVHYFFSMYTHVRCVHFGVLCTFQNRCVHSPMYTDRPATRPAHQASEKMPKIRCFLPSTFQKVIVHKPCILYAKVAGVYILEQVCTCVYIRLFRCTHQKTPIFRAFSAAVYIVYIFPYL